jgi:hypothetical protein
MHWILLSPENPGESYGEGARNNAHYWYVARRNAFVFERC